MTMERHVDPEALGGIEELPESHPDRRHVERCPRCRAALAAYRVFLEAPEGLPESERAAARARLGAARARLGGARPGAAPAVGRPRWWARPAWRPALAASLAVVAVSVIYIANSGHFRGREATHLRGARPGGSGAAAGSIPEIVEVTRDGVGALRFRWRAVEGADGYRVTLFSAGLEIVARHEAGRDTSLTLSPSDVSGGTSRARYGQVAAIRDGEETATSRMFPLGAR